MGEAPLRLGILGAAKIAPKALIAPASLSRRAEVVAIAARDPERAESRGSPQRCPSRATRAIPAPGAGGAAAAERGPLFSGSVRPTRALSGKIARSKTFLPPEQD